ncbi:MAG: hypothetical protein CMJ62_10390 [Planctomycetaceae bacterium]|nr:hypothetical protein [Planctomycetaceae bacterium]
MIVFLFARLHIFSLFQLSKPSICKSDLIGLAKPCRRKSRQPRLCLCLSREISRGSPACVWFGLVDHPGISFSKDLEKQVTGQALR